MKIKFCPVCEELLKPGYSPLQGSCSGCGWVGLWSSSKSDFTLAKSAMEYVSMDIETTGLDEDTCQVLEFGAVIDDCVSPVAELPTFRKIVVRQEFRGQPYALWLNSNLFKMIADASTDPWLRLNPHEMAKMCREWTDFAGAWASDDSVVFRFDTWLQGVEGVSPDDKPGIIDKFRSWYAATKLECTSIDELSKQFALWVAARSLYCYESGLGWQFAQWLRENGMDPKKFNAAGKNFASFDDRFLKLLPNFSEQINYRHRVIDPAQLYVLPEDDKLPDTKTCLKRAGLPDTVAHTAVEDAISVVWLQRIGLRRLWR
jgi:hypothetical protein